MVHQWPEVSSKSARDEGCVDGWEERTAPLSLGPFPACKPKLQQAGAYYLVFIFSLNLQSWFGAHMMQI